MGNKLIFLSLEDRVFVYTLYYHSACPLSRQSRIILKELELNFTLQKEEYWLRKTEFLKINPAGELPILITPQGLIICGVYPIVEYLAMTYHNSRLFVNDLALVCEMRRLLIWFNDKFYREITKCILDEKFIKLLTNSGAPRTEYLRTAKVNLNYHLDYLSKLIYDRSFALYDKLSIIDIVVASHLSILDYFGEISWHNYQIIKDWFLIIKSRSSMRPILSEQLASFIPPKHYKELDF